MSKKSKKKNVANKKKSKNLKKLSVTKKNTQKQNLKKEPKTPVPAKTEKPITTKPDNPDNPPKPTKSKENARLTAALSYIIPIIPYFREKEDKFIKSHAIQGMNLFLLIITYSVVYNVLVSFVKVKEVMLRGGIVIYVTPWWIKIPLKLIGIALVVFDILGLVYAIRGKEIKLPVVKNINFFK